MNVANTAYKKNEAAFRTMKSDIDAQYPVGHFLALEDGQIVADAPTYEKLTKTLNAQGKDHTEIFVACAGMDYPEYGAILTTP